MVCQSISTLNCCVKFSFSFLFFMFYVYAQPVMTDFLLCQPAPPPSTVVSVSASIPNCCASQPPPSATKDSTPIIFLPVNTNACCLWSLAASPGTQRRPQPSQLILLFLRRPTSECPSGHQGIWGRQGASGFHDLLHRRQGRFEGRDRGCNYFCLGRGLFGLSPSNLLDVHWL